MQRATLGQIFRTFLKLGCLSFGGPIAHLGYFQEEFVRRRQWISATEFADLVALCQFLPGPASSQVGFAIGHRQGGIAGAFLAWCGFTLPSAAVMLGLALGLRAFGDFSGSGWICGLKLAAVAVVANAIWSMATKLCPDRGRAFLALASAVFMLLMKEALWQVVAIALGGLAGWLFFHPQNSATPPEPIGRSQKRAGWPWLLVFALCLVGLPIVRELYPGGWLAVVEGFYRAGSLVFGGGHVVLPLLDGFTVSQGWIDKDTFLAGYGAAQALPGPLFAYTAFLGASLSVGPGGLVGGILALVSTYVPSWLLVLGTLPYWEGLRCLPSAQSALQGTNSAVVGLLLAAFYDPVWTVAITDSKRLAFALVVFGCLRFAAAPPWLLVLSSAAAGFLVF